MTSKLKKPILTDVGLSSAMPAIAVDEYGQRRNIELAGERALTLYVDKQEIVTLMTIGNNVQKYTFYDTPGGEYKFDISHLPKGRYIVEVHVNGKLEYKTRINK